MKTLTILIPDTLEDLNPEQLGVLVAQGEELTKLFKAAKEFTKAKLENGTAVPGWQMGDGKRSRAWLSDEDAKKALAAQGINDPYKPQELISVADAEKKPGIDTEKLKTAWRWEAGSKILKPAPVSAALAAAATRPDYGF